MLEKSVGNWVGLGTFEMEGAVTKPVVETLSVFTTDFTGVYSYVRKSNIGVGADIATHDEVGYIGDVYSQVALSRGTVVRLAKAGGDSNTIRYVAGLVTDDVSSMTREITISEDSNKMQWNNVMGVTKDDLPSLEHEIKTEFVRVGKT